ncbi:hypothetical protein D3C81_1968460 [compost metagenome]
MHEALLVGTDSLAAEEHALGNFLVAAALGEELQYHQFAVIYLAEKLQLGIGCLVMLYCLAGEIVVAGQYRLDCTEQFAQVFLLAHIARGAGVHATHCKQSGRLRGQYQNLQWQGHGLEAGKHLQPV